MIALMIDRFRTGLAWLLFSIVLAVWGAAGAPARAQTPAAPLEVRIGYVARQIPSPPLYDLTATPQDEGSAGARLAILDNNTSGSFLGQHFDMDEAILPPDQSPVAAARKLADGGAGLILADLPAEQLLAVADALKGRDAVLFNVSAQDNSLRGKDCRANMFHVAPSRAMLTDALAQFLVVKRWPRIFLIVGQTEADASYAASFRASAKKFGLTIVAEKTWTFGPLAQGRGDAVTQGAALVFTRAADSDMIIVADEEDNFGDYIPYHTADPKLVGGTQGLIAASWHRTQFAFGAEQLQDRFLRLAHRRMRPVDYQAWTAVRAIGEAVVHVRSADPRALSGFMVDPQFSVAVFKGVAASFRPWDHQLRQPLLLAQPAFLVALAPIPGFLHQRTPLDTLGIDEPEMQCRLQ